MKKIQENYLNYSIIYLIIIIRDGYYIYYIGIKKVYNVNIKNLNIFVKFTQFDWVDFVGEH